MPYALYKMLRCPMGEPTRVLIIAFVAVLLLAACESTRSAITTESGYKLTTEGGDPLRSYTARAADYVGR
jgi:hypothetical protein